MTTDRKQSTKTSFFCILRHLKQIIRQHENFQISEEKFKMFKSSQADSIRVDRRNKP